MKIDPKGKCAFGNEHSCKECTHYTLAEVPNPKYVKWSEFRNIETLYMCEWDFQENFL